MNEKNMTPEKEPLLEVKNLRKCFPLKKTLMGKVTSELVAVDDVSFKLYPGETLGIVGESGCGKTTMGRTILKLHKPSGGRIIFDGKDVTHLEGAESHILKSAGHFPMETHSKALRDYLRGWLRFNA